VRLNKGTDSFKVVEFSRFEGWPTLPRNTYPYTILARKGIILTLVLTLTATRKCRVTRFEKLETLVWPTGRENVVCRQFFSK
jgi:hypothetical protein